jgi:hypothetical protein
LRAAGSTWQERSAKVKKKKASAEGQKGKSGKKAKRGTRGQREETVKKTWQRQRKIEIIE